MTMIISVFDMHITGALTIIFLLILTITIVIAAVINSNAN